MGGSVRANVLGASLSCAIVALCALCLVGCSQGSAQMETALGGDEASSPLADRERLENAVEFVEDNFDWLATGNSSIVVPSGANRNKDDYALEGPIPYYVVDGGGEASVSENDWFLVSCDGFPVAWVCSPAVRSEGAAYNGTLIYPLSDVEGEAAESGDRFVRVEVEMPVSIKLSGLAQEVAGVSSREVANSRWILNSVGVWRFDPSSVEGLSGEVAALLEGRSSKLASVDFDPGNLPAEVLSKLVMPDEFACTPLHIKEYVEESGDAYMPDSASVSSDGVLREDTQSEQFLRALAKASEWMTYELARSKGSYGYEGNPERDLFELGGRIPEFRIDKDGIVSEDPEKVGYLYPVYCNGEPFALFRIESKQAEWEHSVLSAAGLGLSGCFRSVIPVSQGTKECLSANPSVACVYVSGGIDSSECPLAEYGIDNGDWVGNRNLQWFSSDLSGYGHSTEKRDSDVSFSLSELPDQMQADIYFSDPMRVPFEVRSSAEDVKLY